MSDSLRLDPELAARAEALFRELGLDLSTAVHLFLLQSLREQGLPFTLRLTSSAEERRSSRNAGENEEAPAGMSDEMLRPSPADQTEPIPAFGEDAQHSQRADDEEPEKDDAVRLPPASEILPDEQDDDVDDDSDSEEHDGEFFHEPSRPAAAEENAFREMGDELRQAFLNARLIGAPLRRVRSLNRLYGIGEPNPHVQGWREVYVSGDEPFALDFGMIRVELGFHGGGSLRMMDGRLPDSVLEADAVYPRDLSAIFSSVIGQPLSNVTTSGLRHDGREQEQLSLRFANGCTLNFTPGGDWGALWLTDAHGSIMFAPETVWLRVLGDKTWSGLRRMGA